MWEGKTITFALSRQPGSFEFRYSICTEPVYWELPENLFYPMFQLHPLDYKSAVINPSNQDIASSRPRWRKGKKVPSSSFSQGLEMTSVLLGRYRTEKCVQKPDYMDLGQWQNPFIINLQLKSPSRNSCRIDGISKRCEIPLFRRLQILARCRFPRELKEWFVSSLGSV